MLSFGNSFEVQLKILFFFFSCNVSICIFGNWVFVRYPLSNGGKIYLAQIAGAT